MQTANDSRPSVRVMAGVFLVALCSMMLEILITRIFSVTMRYNYAFLVISFAMFGITLGGIRVYRHPLIYSAANVNREMVRSALWFSSTAVVSVLAHVLMPFRSDFAVLWIALTYPLLSFPFYFVGICVCLALTKYPGKVSRFYAADLIGAACGCVLVIFVLKFVDAPSGVVLVAALGGLAALLLASGSALRGLRRVASVLTVIFASLVVLNAQAPTSFLRLRWAKGHEEPAPLYEKWNTFSRITVRGTPDIPTGITSEGISSAYPEGRVQRQLALLIDAGAETTLTSLDSGIEHLDYLQYDIKNIVHYIRPNSSVLIIGAGGGRDVLAALLFGQKAVRAVEMNPDILDTVNHRFGDFTGHLNHDPRVTFVNHEARSYMARTDEHFDIIEASFIDTWAATGAGALSLTENSIYTVDAWRLFLERLTPRGVLSFSRWYVSEMPAEAYRLTSLAAEALRESGVADPRAHILMARNLRQSDEGVPFGAVTILVSKAPLTSLDIDQFESVSKKMHFDLILTPRSMAKAEFGALASSRDSRWIVSELGLDISPPTDNSPFFFYMSPFRHPSRLFSSDLNLRAYGLAGETIIGLLVFVGGLTALWIVKPVLGDARERGLASIRLHLLFFGAIGLGFMLIEISQMQRLIVFLGDPTYALSVVLFALLLSSGVGSYTTNRVDIDARKGAGRLGCLIASLFLFGLITPSAISAFASSSTAVRVIVAIGVLSPVGLFMGMAFPLGLKQAGSHLEEFTPALWGVNGATSICGSILAVAIAMNAGISYTFWTGVCCYLVAIWAFISNNGRTTETNNAPRGLEPDVRS